MDFALSANQESIRDAIGKICSRFDDAYWLKKDKEGGYPADFHRALADAGWLGICIPEEYGGSGLGITDAAIMMRTISESGAGMSGASAVHMNVFGLNPVVVFGMSFRTVRAHFLAISTAAAKYVESFKVTKACKGVFVRMRLETQTSRLTPSKVNIEGNGLLRFQ